MKPAKLEPAKTVLTITVGFLVIYAITDIKWLLIVALIIGLAGVFSNYLSEKISFLWMKLAWVLSLIVPNILLSIIFYVFLFPIALLSRIFEKKDPLSLKNNMSSVFKNVDKKFDQSSFKNPW